MWGVEGGIRRLSGGKWVQEQGQETETPASWAFIRQESKCPAAGRQCVQGPTVCPAVKCCSHFTAKDTEARIGILTLDAERPNFKPRPV